MRAAPYWPGKIAVLKRQVHARRIHQVNDWHAVPHRDFLRAQDLGDRLGPPRARLDGGIVRDDHGGAALDLRDPGDNACGRRLPIVLVVSQQQADFKEHRPRIDQLADALARRELAFAMLLFDLLRPAAGAHPLLDVFEPFEHAPHVRHVLRDLSGPSGSGFHSFTFRIYKVPIPYTVERASRPANDRARLPEVKRTRW